MTYRITPTRDYCNENALSYPDFHLAGYDGNQFDSAYNAAMATVELGDDVPWEVIETK
jgi:hypothetical protein